MDYFSILYILFLVVLLIKINDPKSCTWIMVYYRKRWVHSAQFKDPAVSFTPWCEFSLITVINDPNRIKPKELTLTVALWNNWRWQDLSNSFSVLWCYNIIAFWPIRKDEKAIIVTPSHPVIQRKSPAEGGRGSGTCVCCAWFLGEATFSLLSIRP